jgi:Leucine-rich repeat (LRR) protein
MQLRRETWVHLQFDVSVPYLATRKVCCVQISWFCPPNSIGNHVSSGLTLGTAAKLAGVLPVSLLALPQLQYLTLSFCGLTGSIPPALITNTSLEELDLTSNELSGELPSLGGAQSRLQRLYLSQNRLTGVLPGTMEPLPSRLTTTDLRYNGFFGGIPKAFSEHPALHFVGLSQNNLSGTIPKFAQLCLLTCCSCSIA